MTTRASVSPVKRVVFGGPRLGDLVVEVRNDRLVIRRKGEHSKGAITMSWNRIYGFARTEPEEKAS